MDYEDPRSIQADPRRINSASGRAGVASPAAAPPPPWTDMIGQDISRAQSVLGDALGDLTMLAERLFGEGPPDKESAAPVMNGVTYSLTEQVNQLHMRALSIASVARGLNGRL